MNASLKSAKMWRVGFVRMTALCFMVLCLAGIFKNYDRPGFWSLSNLTGPICLGGLLLGIAVFVLGFRSDVAMRDHETISKLPRS
jgi:hypothetical protein